MSKKIILCTMIALVLLSCVSYETESFDSLHYVDVVAMNNNGEPSVLKDFPGSVDSYNDGFAVDTVYSYCICNYIAFLVGVHNLTDSIVTIYDSDIESFVGSYQTDEWKSFGRWHPERDLPSIAEFLKAYSYVYDYDPSLDISLMNSQAFRSSRIYPGESYYGTIFLPLIDGQDYAIEITLPNGHIARHEFDIEPRQ